jgi:hypothetical protein
MVGRSVVLSWSAATDPNQSGGLTYNLRVGTTPFGNDILSSMAAPDGRRRVPQMGNVQQNVKWTLNNLPVGAYYWSVQAVDNSYAGSSFAPEQRFFRNSQPTAQSTLIVMGEDTAHLVPLLAADADGESLTYTFTAGPTNGTLTWVPPSFVYWPKIDYFGMDHISFTASDGHTNSSPATISLVITQVHDVAFPRMEMRTPTRLTVFVEPYERYLIQASQDLIHWVTITNRFSTDGVIELALSDSGVYPHRFYRAELALLPGELTSPQFTSDGFFKMNLSGEIARTYEIQSSTNLISWRTLTNVLISTSPLVVTNRLSTKLPYQFYRMRPLP